MNKFFKYGIKASKQASKQARVNNGWRFCKGLFARSTRAKSVVDPTKFKWFWIYLKALRADARGLSLLVAVIISSLIIVAATGVTKVILAQFRGTTATSESQQAYYAAESGLNRALLILKDKPVGYRIPKITYTMDVGSNRTATINYSVETNTMALNNARFGDYSKAETYYTVPSAWTGDAGQGTGFDFGAVASAGGNPGSCSLDGPPVPANYTTIKDSKDKITQAALEHPCNWNKIRFGETVTVPLYRLKADNTTAINPTDATGDSYGGGIGLFVFRVRTPCKEGKWDATEGAFKCTERWGLYEDQSSSELILKTDDTVINWEISGYDSNGDIVTLLPQNLRVNKKGYQPVRIKKKNSEIYEEKINDAVGVTPATLPPLNSYLEKYTVLKDQNNLGSCYSVLNEEIGLIKNTNKCSGIDVNDYWGGIFEFLNSKFRQQTPNLGASGKDWKRSIDKPYFKFTTIYPLYADKDQKVKIPYLEYQIITDKPIAGNLQIIDVDATVGGFKQSLQVKKPVESSVLEFAVHN